MEKRNIWIYGYIFLGVLCSYLLKSKLIMVNIHMDILRIAIEKKTALKRWMRVDVSEKVIVFDVWKR